MAHIILCNDVKKFSACPSAAVLLSLPAGPEQLMRPAGWSPWEGGTERMDTELTGGTLA